MKIKFFITSIIVVLLTGCTSPKLTFKEYQGAGVFQGRGGAERPVDGIDFWDTGTPYRKYKMLGMIDVIPAHNKPAESTEDAKPPSPLEMESAIASIARRHGGDAVIIVDGGPAPSRTEDGQSGQRVQKLVVIKYLD